MENGEVMKMSKEMRISKKIGKCPQCNSKKKIKVARSTSRFLPRWLIFCCNCNYCGVPKLFLFRAIKAWNKDTIYSVKNKRRGDGEC